MVTARQRRRAVEHLKDRDVSERRACRLVGFSRSAAWAPLKGRDDVRLRSRLKALAEQYPRYGYPTLHAMLKIEGLVRTLSARTDSTERKAYRSVPSDVRTHTAQGADDGAQPSQRALVDGFR